MNRKMRAKLNNQRAKAAKERKPCPRRGEMIMTHEDQTHCDTCGDELVPVVAIAMEQRPPRERMN